MKPDWDKLAAEMSSDKVLVADVDCTEDANKDLCSKFGVRGYPTLKLFNEGDTEGEPYEGGRDLASLKKAVQGMGPSCSVKNYDLCDADQKAKIDELSKLTPDVRMAQIKELEGKMEAAEKAFKDSVDELQSTYKKLMEEKDDTINNIKPQLKGLKAFKDASGGIKKDEL